jgi:hypothetical protein
MRGQHELCLTVELSSSTNHLGRVVCVGVEWGVSELAPVGARQHPRRIGMWLCCPCAHNTLRTSRAVVLTKLTHPVVVDFDEGRGPDGVDAQRALARRPTGEDIHDVADAEEADQAA